MDALEKKLIAKYHTQNPEFGYNIEDGGNSGKHLSELTKQKISKAHKGKYHSADTKRKIGDSLRGEKSYWYGRIPPNASPVICLETKEIFPSTGIAAKAVGLKFCQHIYNACNGTRKTAGGYHWSWLKDYEQEK